MGKLCRCGQGPIPHNVRTSMLSPGMDELRRKYSEMMRSAMHPSLRDTETGRAIMRGYRTGICPICGEKLT